MHYVKHFAINGVNTKQVACIELQGPPNAATEGAVGVLGMDVTSLTHEVYRCVAVNGSIYTWQLLAGGGADTWTKPTGYTDWKWLFNNRPSEVMLTMRYANESLEYYDMSCTHLVRSESSETSVTYEGDAHIYCDYDSYNMTKYSGHFKFVIEKGAYTMTFIGKKDYFVGWEDSNMEEWVETICGTYAHLTLPSSECYYLDLTVDAYKGG